MSGMAYGIWPTRSGILDRGKMVSVGSGDMASFCVLTPSPIFPYGLIASLSLVSLNNFFIESQQQTCNRIDSRVCPFSLSELRLFDEY